MPRSTPPPSATPPKAPPRLPAPWVQVAALGLVLCTPLLLVGMPPLTDLPNHMVRMMLLAGQLEGSAFARHFSVHWVFVPNLGMDLLVPPLLAFLSPAAAAKVLVAVIVAGWVGGLALLGRALHAGPGGARWSPWFLTAAFSAWNGGLLRGFMNFCLSTMLAFWAAGAWLLLRERARSPRALAGLAVLALPLGFVLFVAHLFGAFVFGMVLGADALVRAWRAWRPPPPKAGPPQAGPPQAKPWRALLAALLPPLPAGLMLAALYAATKVLTVGGRTLPERPALLWHTLGSAWYSYPVLLGTLTGLLLLLVLLRARRNGGVAVAPAGLLVLLVMFVLGLALPFAEHGLYYVNVRFQLMAGVLVSVVFLPWFRDRREARGTALVLGAMLALRLGVMLIAWSRTGPYLADVRWILDQIPPGARVGEVQDDTPAPGISPWVVDLALPTDYHFPVYIAALSDRFVPALFDKPGQQPLEAVPAEVATETAMETIRRAVAKEAGQRPIDPALGYFDMMIVTGTWTGAPPTMLHGRLVRVAQRPGIALYKVVPAS
ncbi:MAG: hypothetical protein KGK10_01985 [Rhodospirillales bacterium]|nr:hypothetical protein [Rhodospirillales bacterium]